MFGSRSPKEDNSLSEDRKRILQMLAEGKVSVADAERLLLALGDAAGPTAPPPGDTALAPVERRKPRYLRVTVEPVGEGDSDAPHVNLRVPLQLLRAGIKLGALIPPQAQAQVSEALDQKGISINLGDIPPEAIEELIEGMDDLTVDVDAGDLRVRVFCES